MQRVLIDLGKVLFRYRAVIAVPFFIALSILSRPVSKPLVGYVLLLVGVSIRMWAAGYIGGHARTRCFHTDYRIISGPYRLFRHPLYIGNLLLVLGVAMLYRPPLWYGTIIIMSFIIMYSIIGYSETWHLRERPKKQVPYRCANLRGEVSTVLVVILIVILNAILGYGR